MNTLEMIARHWAVTTINPGGGRGGVPELTETDVAHALGAVADKKSRDLVLVLWNHAGVTRALRDEVETAFRHALVSEYATRVRELVTAKLELHLMECELEPVNNSSLRERALRPYRAGVDRARSRMWPWDSNVYRRVFDAAKMEVRNPRICPDCNGRASVFINERKVDCEGCAGTGKKTYMQSQRCASLGVSYPAYRSGWYKVYEWAYAELQSRQRQVLDALVQVLLREEPVAA